MYRTYPCDPPRRGRQGEICSRSVTRVSRQRAATFGGHPASPTRCIRRRRRGGASGRYAAPGPRSPARSPLLEIAQVRSDRQPQPMHESVRPPAPAGPRSGRRAAPASPGRDVPSRPWSGPALGERRQRGGDLVQGQPDVPRRPDEGEPAQHAAGRTAADRHRGAGGRDGARAARRSAARTARAAPSRHRPHRQQVRGVPSVVPPRDPFDLKLNFILSGCRWTTPSNKEHHHARRTGSPAPLAGSAAPWSHELGRSRLVSSSSARAASTTPGRGRLMMEPGLDGVSLPGDVTDSGAPPGTWWTRRTAAAASTSSSTTPASSARAPSRGWPTTGSTTCARCYEVNVIAPLALTRGAASAAAQHRDDLSWCSAATRPSRPTPAGGSTGRPRRRSTRSLPCLVRTGARRVRFDPGDMRTEMTNARSPARTSRTAQSPTRSYQDCCGCWPAARPAGGTAPPTSRRRRPRDSHRDCAGVQPSDDWMRAATEPPEARGLARDEVRLLVAGTGRGASQDGSATRHAARPGDLLVVNNSATLPAAVDGHAPTGRRSPCTSRHRWTGGHPVELRPGRRAPPPLTDARLGERVMLPAGTVVHLGRGLPRRRPPRGQPAVARTAGTGG